ncbi:MAG: hypothetical protein AUH81_07425 [Candidatus Rokubacteria bacterium 13_1_40CM_4_69_5]|nr:MAG: hypothetical protein AUH81_07425 [Candidatus Rokubacteria bacterium 13_1_40CM_4_69_5]
MSKRTAIWSLALALVSPAFYPGLAAAAQNAVLYEATETMKLKRKDNATSRVATAALMGWVSAGTSICPDWLAAALNVPACGVTAIANDNINLATGQGPVSGKFTVVIQGDNPVDGPELAIVEGSLHGTIDLSPAVLSGVPLGAIGGRWSARGTPGGPLDGIRMGGTFTGTFRLPFVMPGDPTKTPLYMLNPYAFAGSAPSPTLGTDFVLAAPSTEFSLGVPTVRLELTFVDAPAAAGDDD